MLLLYFLIGLGQDVVEFCILVINWLCLDRLDLSLKLNLNERSCVCVSGSLNGQQDQKKKNFNGRNVYILAQISPVKKNDEKQVDCKSFWNTLCVQGYLYR